MLSRHLRCNPVHPIGDLVWAGIASANRDPQVFERADELDLGRQPNRHLSFGQGIHYCVGAPLARLEAQIAFSTLLQRFPKLRLAEARKALRWRKSPSYADWRPFRRH